jgi:two-component system, LytTR family, response regulator
MQHVYHIIHIDDQPEDLAAFKRACTASEHTIALDSYTDVKKALKAIADDPPDIIALDIEMGKENGLDIARQLSEGPSMIVFITSYSSYALQAFSLFALHFIVKPARPDDLAEILSRYTRLKPSLIKSNIQSNQVNMLAKRLENPEAIVQNLFIHQSDRISIVKINDILYLEADNAYTKFYTTDGKKIVSSESLKCYESMLYSQPDLIRVHRSYMVNRNHVKSIHHKKHLWYAQMSNGSKIDISRLKKDWVIAELIK